MKNTKKTGKMLGSSTDHLRRGLFSRSNSAVTEERDIMHEEREHQRNCAEFKNLKGRSDAFSALGAMVRLAPDVFQIDKFHGVALYMFSRFDNPKTNNKNSEDQQHI